MALIQVFCGGSMVAELDADEVVVDGCRFNVGGLESLARSAGELFVAERHPELDVVVVHRFVGLEIGSGYGRLVVQRNPPTGAPIAQWPPE